MARHGAHRAAGKEVTLFGDREMVSMLHTQSLGDGLTCVTVGNLDIKC